MNSQQRDLAVGDTVVETTPSGREHVYTVTAVDVQPKHLFYAPPGRYVVISCNHVHQTMRQETIFDVDWMEVAS